jgi:hypothetical protein
MAAASSGLILAGGRLEPYKQVDLVVRALQHLPANRRLLVFGEGPDRERLEAIAGSVGVAPRVTFAGRLPDDELDEQLGQAAVFASMSRKEAFGLTVLESAAAGAPVVASDIPAYREVAELLPAGTVQLVDVDADPATLAAAIEEAVNGERPIPPSPATLPTWDSMATGVAAVYGRVLGEVAGRTAAAWRVRPIERIHVTGASGTGKSSLAATLAELLGAPVSHLDDVAREPGTSRIRSEAERDEAVSRIIGSRRWVTDGIHTGWTDPLCEHADVIVWLDHVSTRARLLRVLRRFVAGGLAESRRQRGFKRLFRPASYARHLRELARATSEIRSYESAAPGPAGDAGSHAATVSQLGPFMHKVVHCRSWRDVDDLIAAVRDAANAAAAPGAVSLGANE